MRRIQVVVKSNPSDDLRRIWVAVESNPNGDLRRFNTWMLRCLADQESKSKELKIVYILMKKEKHRIKSIVAIKAKIEKLSCL